MRRVLTHFGEPMRHSPYGLRLTRDTYAFLEKKRTGSGPRDLPSVWAAEAEHFDDEAHSQYRDENVRWMYDRAMRNFDLNMAFFAQIDVDAFEAALQKMLKVTKFLKPVTDLHDFEDVEGVYVMVQDKYHQAYIGQAWNIRKRIKQHWNARKRLDRLVFGSEEESVISIDSFRPMDTTRIFAGATSKPDHWESRMVEKFPKEFLMNRIGGGPGNILALLQMNRRALI